MDAKANSRPLLMTGNSVALSAMRPEDVPIFARWNQDLEFTARIGTPGGVHTVEMRQEAYSRNSKFRADGVEFAVIELGVKPQQVVPGQAETADGSFLGEASMRPVPIVAMEPGQQGLAALL
jgi:RimJ/RimL family protein N-acetyltransferase